MALVAAADCNSVSVGLDAGHYEGPLRIRLPVKLSPSASAEGAWSFEVPLPTPASQKLLSRCACLTHFPCMLQLCRWSIPLLGTHICNVSGDTE